MDGTGSQRCHKANSGFASGGWVSTAVGHVCKSMLSMWHLQRGLIWRSGREIFVRKIVADLPSNRKTAKAWALQVQRFPRVFANQTLNMAWVEKSSICFSEGTHINLHDYPFLQFRQDPRYLYTYRYIYRTWRPGGVEFSTWTLLYTIRHRIIFFLSLPLTN